jgi:aerobic carbon-monoxide dehydrogenase medium subunit
MIPSVFDYYSPANVDEALKLLSEHGSEAKLLAGGHSLIPAMRLRLAQPERLIDIGALRPQLSYIKEEGGLIKIGAMTSHYQIESSDLLKEKAPLLTQAASMIGDGQVRNWGTIGGSLVHADPSSDLPSVMLALGAEAVLKSSRGERTVPMSGFFTGILQTAVEPDELLIELRFKAPAGKKSSYQKLANKASHYAVVGAAAVVGVNGDKFSDVAVAFSGLAEVPLRFKQLEQALVGQSTDAATIDRACQGFAAQVDALEDLHGSKEYRRAMAEVFARRAIKAAIAE